MVKRTLYFGNPAYLHLEQEQLIIALPDDTKKKDHYSPPLPDAYVIDAKRIPIEDIGVVLLDHPRITLSNALLNKLANNNVAVLVCNESHLPVALLQNLDGNTLQSQRYKEQLEATEPLKKQLWQQTIKQKIKNQAAVMSYANASYAPALMRWSDEVLSGDSTNVEGKAAVHYWKYVFAELITEYPEDAKHFVRDRIGAPPNDLLNYGYAVLRAITARALVSTGLMATLGIHHRNQYNAYCLADDIMEPYRPVVDKCVIDILKNNETPSLMDPSIKRQLLQIPVLDVALDGKNSPLMVAMSRTTSSLQKCYSGELRKVLYPNMK
jgi:CRISPR-associated protein Cas1